MSILAALLQGVIVGLDRSLFTVIVLPITNPTQYLDTDIVQAADEVFLLSLSPVEAEEVSTRLRLDYN